MRDRIPPMALNTLKEKNQELYEGLRVATVISFIDEYHTL